MAINVSDFLQTQGFHEHPFITTNAEQEIDRLPAFFVPTPVFEQLAGSPQQPTSAILFASVGCGKTSHRFEIARRVSASHRNPALAVMFCDFDIFFQEELTISLKSYLPIIRRKTLDALVERLKLAKRQREKLQRNTDLAAQFCAIQKMYSMPIDVIESPPNTEAWIDHFHKTRYGAQDWLKLLSQIASAAGFASIYFLVDGVDEWTETLDRPRLAVDLLKPLLNASSILEGCGFAFKFFLPRTLQPLLSKSNVGQHSHIQKHNLRWENLDLAKILSTRLEVSSASRNLSPSAVKRFSDLCKDLPDADEQLVAAAVQSPRQLIDLARRIIECHCQQTEDPDALISAHTVRTVLEQASAAAELRIVADTDSQTPLLFFNKENGDILIGHERRTHIALPKQLRHAMEFLWDNRHRTVRYEELQYELYGDTIDNRGDPKSSCDKIIQRLRLVIEPDKQGSRTYIDVQLGIGYVLNNFHDTDDTP